MHEHLDDKNFDSKKNIPADSLVFSVFEQAFEEHGKGSDVDAWFEEAEKAAEEVVEPPLEEPQPEALSSDHPLLQEYQDKKDRRAARLTELRKIMKQIKTALSEKNASDYQYKEFGELEKEFQIREKDFEYIYFSTSKSWHRSFQREHGQRQDQRNNNFDFHLSQLVDKTKIFAAGCGVSFE